MMNACMAIVAPRFLCGRPGRRSGQADGLLAATRKKVRWRTLHGIRQARRLRLMVRNRAKIRIVRNMVPYDRERQIIGWLELAEAPKKDNGVNS